MNTSCFACRGGECVALKPTKACCEGCRFFKTRRRAKAGRKHAQRLIAAKPEEAQRYIAGKYYGGKMPWREKEGKRNDQQGTVAAVPPQLGDHGAAAAAG